MATLEQLKARVDKARSAYTRGPRAATLAFAKAEADYAAALDCLHGQPRLEPPRKIGRTSAIGA